MNQIEVEDIKLWIGELVIENKLLQKKIAQMEIELKRLKSEQEASYNILPVLDELEPQK